MIDYRVNAETHAKRGLLELALWELFHPRYRENLIIGDDLNDKEFDDRTQNRPCDRDAQSVGKRDGSREQPRP